MDDVLNINGIEYIKKDRYNALRNDIDRLLNSTKREFESILGSDKVDDDNMSKALVNNRTNKQKKPRKRRKYRKGTDLFRPDDYAKKEYVVSGMTNDGLLDIWGISSDKRFSIKDVIYIQKKVIEQKISINGAKQVANDIGISYNMLMKICYNIECGVFDEYIAKYKSSLDINKPLKKKKIMVQNNPEKRKESNIY